MVESVVYFFLIWAGYCWCFVALCNRLLSQPIEHHRLDRLRILLHDLPMLVGPFLVYWALQLPGFTPTRTVSLSDHFKPLMWLFILGCFGLVYTWAVNHSRRRASAKLSHETILHRIGPRESKQFQYEGTGGKARAARLLGNESTQCEFNRKRLDYFNLPEELDGLRILHISDVHFMGIVPRKYFEAVFDYICQQEYDLAVFSGDLVDEPDKLDWLKTTFANVKSKYGNFAILGNHDKAFADLDEERTRLEQSGWKTLTDQVEWVHVGESPIAIYGSEAPWIGQLPERVDELSQAEFRIFVSHTPDNIAWAKKHNVELMFSGHNHGGQIRIPFYGPLYSPSRFGIHYACGVISEQPTLLHVSRGLSARLPIRYNCLPEVTEIVLKGLE